MLNGKLISIDAALESTFASSAYLGNISMASVCIWVGEVMDLMGAPQNFVHKVTDGNLELGHPPPVVIEGFRGTLPDDMYKIDQVRSCDNDRTAFRATTNSFHEGKGNYNWLPGNDGSAPRGASSYSTNGNYIFTNVDNIELEISYYAFPVDKDGIPMIPDDETIKLAVGAYIKYKAYLPQWELGNIPDKVMEKTQQDYHWRVGQAISRARTPNADQLESMKNIMLRLIPKINQAHGNFFENLGNKERFTRNNNNS